MNLELRKRKAMVKLSGRFKFSHTLVFRSSIIILNFFIDILWLCHLDGHGISAWFEP